MTTATSRRAFLALIALGSLPATALAQILHAQDAEELDPTDLVPRRFSVEDFISLDENEIYKVNLAVRRGRTITINGYTPSQSRQIIKAAGDDWPQTRRRLAERHNLR